MVRTIKNATFSVRKMTLEVRALKMFLLFLLVGFWTFSLITAVEHPKIAPSTFCYDNPSCGPDTWGGSCKSGQHQSPVNISLKKNGPQPSRAKFEMNDHYLLERSHWFYAQNNGHTAQFKLSSNTSNLRSKLRICGTTLTSCYKFGQFHFHWHEVNSDGSEHMIDGKRFTMELHIVHYKEKYGCLAEALGTNENDAVAVMGIFFKISDKDNPLLESIVKAVEQLRQPGKVKKFQLPLSISSFYPQERSYATYSGSLTTPTCDDKVLWTVFLTPIPISKNQMNTFRKVRNAEGVSHYNARPLQPLNGRKISFYQAEEFKQLFDEPKGKS